MKLYKIVLWILFLIMIYFLAIKIVELKRVYDEREIRKKLIIDEINKNFKPRGKDFYKKVERVK